MNKFFVIIFLFISNIIYGQLVKCEEGGQIGTHNENINVNLGLQFEPRLDTSGRHLLFVVGVGGEYFFDKTLLFDSKILWPLFSREHVGHVYKINGIRGAKSQSLPVCFISGHYMFDTKFQKQYICPELGYNFNHVLGNIAITPSIYYYFPLHSSNAWIENIFFSLKFIYTSWHKEK